MKTVQIAAALAAVLLTACGASGIINDPADPDGKDNPRKTVSLTTRQAEFVATGNTFAFNFLDRIDAASAGKDYFISPLSMQFLLGMILEAANGKTADEISTLLGYGKGETQEVNEYCLAMMSQLPKLDKQTKLAIANSIFVDKGFTLKQPYVDAMGKYYSAEVANLDFADTKGSAAVINKWCSDNTNGLIPKILDETSPDMLAYLLNAIYFKSQWSDKFNKNYTTKEDFTTAAGSKTKVEMMKKYAKLDYCCNEVFSAVTLPYGNGAFSMTVMLPEGKNKVSDIAGYLKKNGWSSVYNYMDDYSVDLWLPKFSFAWSMQLKDLLSKMGMPTAFSTSADLKSMSDRALRLSFVKQDSFVQVDEEGTEAAAVSSAGVEKTTAIPNPKEAVFHANRPFLYVIRERSTGAVLFAGSFGNPK